ncbi:MAG TPA: FAD/NAD(P)-binding protein [Ignavibacteriaceae bacterium]|nr:FAD/NAD(P)-binding protein [Ignavibacteriaceae bacterium]
MSIIAVIGAGLSGRLLAMNLLRHSSGSDSPKIILIDKGSEDYMGPAYSAGEKYLLLNVPADRMGAFSAQPDHFLKWVRKKGIEADKYDFLPRSLYRDYILELLNEALLDNKENFQQMHGEAIDIEDDGSQMKIILENGRKVSADKVILALGNFPSADPKIANAPALKSKRYIRNPWSPGILSAIPEDEEIFLIGTGQTMVDLALILYKKNHKGKITGISRRGYLPLVHKDFDSYDSYYEELKDKNNVNDLFKVIRKHLERADSLRKDVRGVIDSLRPVTQKIWMDLPSEEKLRFLRHLYRYWEIIRSRIPPESDKIIKELISSGRLRIIAGRVTDLKEGSEKLEIEFLRRGESKTATETAGYIINCCGPESDYNRIDDPLIKNLLKKGMIRPGPANLGIDALPNGSVIDKKGEVSDKLFTIGSPLRGVLFETVAVPEIRKQAEELAKILIG